MNLNISGHHVDMTEALHAHVAAKMARIERHFDHLIEADVVLAVDKPVHRAQVTMNVRGNTLHAEATGDDMYGAVNVMVDKLDKQTRRHRDKTAGHRKRSDVNTATSSEE